MQSFRILSDQKSKQDTDGVVKVKFQCKKTLYKRPEEYTIPMICKTYHISDKEMDFKIQEAKYVCKRNQPFSTYKRNTYDPHRQSRTLKMNNKGIHSIVSSSVEISKNLCSIFSR